MDPQTSSKRRGYRLECTSCSLANPTSAKIAAALFAEVGLGRDYTSWGSTYEYYYTTHVHCYYQISTYEYYYTTHCMVNRKCSYMCAACLGLGCY